MTRSLTALGATLALVLLLPPTGRVAAADDLPARWDDLTAGQWPQAMERSAQTCILPFGILEKHGPHAPIGTDMIKAREIALRAAKKEYAVVFPDYYFGQINEARQQPGTFAVPGKLALELLEATCDEIARNGFKRIFILNGHGGNPELISYFGQTRLEKRRSYAMYLYNEFSQSFDDRVNKKRRSDPEKNMHAGEGETALMMYLRPDTVHLEHAQDESGADEARLKLPPDLYTPIWWYARFPNHYSGEGQKATRELGEAMAEEIIDHVAELLKIVKADDRTLELQNEYFDRVEKLGARK
jgi:creatinine amidohydrolase